MGNNTGNKHIALLKGGLSAERDVSLSTAKSVSEALTNLGYKVSEVDVGWDVQSILSEIKPDIVFNALHGTYGEDGCIQGILEFLRIPYTHSGVLSSSVAMHKPTAKILFESVGIKCAKGGVYTRDEVLAGDVMDRPYVIKPVDEGSSVGVLIVFDGDELNSENIPDGNEFLIEEFIEGKELTSAVLGDVSLGVIEIVPKMGFYDYRNKYTQNMTEYVIPAQIDKNIYDKVKEYTLKAHNILKCNSLSRSDFRLSNDGEIYILEINTHPGMTSTSLVPKLAKDFGISFEELIENIVNSAKLNNGV